MANTSGTQPDTGEWTDSLRGVFLWSSVNTREGIPDVMTTSTCALWRIHAIKDRRPGTGGWRQRHGGDPEPPSGPLT